MEIRLTSNADRIAADLNKKAGDVKRASGRAIKASLRVLYDEDRKQVNTIYARPIPKITRGPNKGKTKWKRKGTLRRGEAMRFPDPLTAMLTNDTPYAEPRHELNQPGPDGVTRYDPWRRRTFEKAGRKAVDVFESTLLGELAK